MKEKDIDRLAELGRIIQEYRRLPDPQTDFARWFTQNPRIVEALKTYALAAEIRRQEGREPPDVWPDLPMELIIRVIKEQETTVEEYRALLAALDSGEMAEYDKHGPRFETQIRGQIFRELKEQHPDWTQRKVAIEAAKRLGYGITADTVRYTYKALGWHWDS